MDIKPQIKRHEKRDILQKNYLWIDIWLQKSYFSFMKNNFSQLLVDLNKNKP